MRRALLLELLAATQAGADLPEEALAEVSVRAEHVAGAVHVLRGGGANVAASVGPDGALLVDDTFAPLVPRLRAALAAVGDFPVRWVVNTHWHADHAGGNAALAAEATVIAHRRARERLASGHPGGLGPPVRPAPPRALPAISFDSRLTLHLNGEDILLAHLPRAHTDGDVAAYFPGSNVVHLGDCFVTYGFPFVDLDSGGSVLGLATAVERLMAELPADVRVIPGHGPVSGREDVLRFAAVLRDCVARVDAARRRGLGREELPAARVLAGYEHLGGALYDAGSFAALVYRELDAGPGGG
jgi:cyclase